MVLTVGIDEVGRGCWAGPLVAAAVLLSEPIEGLKDSKLLSAKQRLHWAGEIKQHASIGLGWVWPAQIDELGLTQAIAHAMQQAVDQIQVRYNEIIIDGNYNFLPLNARARCLIKADQSIPAVSAASIIAKVTRDAYMAEQALKYPGYGFESHVGYGTKQHISALEKLGICDLHRLSYKPIKAFAV